MRCAVCPSTSRSAARTYQLNLASLAVFEHMARRWQLIMEAHADNPFQPDYEAADYFAGTRTERMGVAPELKTFVAVR